MKQWCLIFGFMCLLAACTSQNSEERMTLDVCQTYENMQSLHGEANVVTDYGQRVYEFMLSFTYDVESGFLIEIVEPINLSGIKAIITSEDSYLEFEDARLEIGRMQEEELSPMQCIPLMVDYIQNGYISEYASETIDEKEYLRLRFSDPNEMMGTGQEALLWIDKENENFLKSEILLDGTVLICCEFTEFEKG